METTVPPEIIARGPLAREAYNRALLDGKTHVKRVPVMLLGQGGAGKTPSFVIDSMYNVSEDPPVEITRPLEKLLRDGDKMEDEHKIDVCLWDFGGQSVFYDTQPLFLAPRAIFILVYNLSQGLHEKAGKSNFRLERRYLRVI